MKYDNYQTCFLLPLHDYISGLCSITGYYWFSKDGQTIELDNITISHGGRYTCTADNGVGAPITEHLHITVLCKYLNKSVTSQLSQWRSKLLGRKLHRESLSLTLSLSLSLSLTLFINNFQTLELLSWRKSFILYVLFWIQKFFKTFICRCWCWVIRNNFKLWTGNKNVKYLENI